MPKYITIDTIPAKVFFEILSSKDFNLLIPFKIEVLLNKAYSLVKNKYIDLNEVFVSIYDSFFIKSDSEEAKRYLQLNKEIAFLEFKIAVIKQVLHFTLYNKTTQKMRYDIIDALKKGCNIEIDKNVPFIDEVQRVLNIEIGIIQNDLSIAKNEFDTMVKSSKDKVFDYEEKIVAMEGIIGRKINEGIMLDKYIAYEKQIAKIIEKQKTK